MTRPWIVDAIGERAFSRLADELPGSEVQSVLLEVMRHRARARTPADVLAQYRRDGFVRPNPIDQRVYAELDMHLLAAAEGFDAIELSPLAPLGACSAVALTDQNRTVSALRATEVMSDPTNVLALECAERLHAAPAMPVHLTTVHRVVRAQPYPKLPGYAPHFRIFVLASAGREAKDHAFAQSLVVRHARTMLAALDRLEQHGYKFPPRRVEVFARADRSAPGDRIAAELGATRAALDHAYYNGGIRFQIYAGDAQLADGGMFDWVSKLTSNSRNVFVASGMGAQLAAMRFRIS